MIPLVVRSVSMIARSLPVGRHHLLRSLVLLFLSAVIAPPPQLYAGRGDKAGTAAGYQLLVPVGAYPISLGGSSVARVDGLDATYWNPAGFSAGQRYHALFSHMSYLADIGVDFLAFGLPVGEIASVAVSIKSLSFGEIPVTTEDFPDGTGAYASPTFLVFGGTVARDITDHISFGVTAHYLYERIEAVSASGVAATLGLQYSGLGGVRNLSVGVVVRNLGPQLHYDGDGLIRTGSVEDALRGNSRYKVEAAFNDLPSTLEVGLGYALDLSGITHANVTTTFQNNNYSDDVYRVGIEVLLNEYLSIRTGLSLMSETETNYTLFGPAFGIGLFPHFTALQMRFDYAFQQVQLFGGNHNITLGIEF